MKTMRSKTKVLVTLVVTLLLLGALAVTSFAADKTASYGNKYGQIVPTDSKLESPKSSFKFYGDKATLYFMRISKGKNDANYAVEIYSDKACTKLIRSMSGEYGSKGNSPLAISWSFKSTKSGTYYGKCYTYVSRDDGNVIDKDSIETFKIKVDRLSKKTVNIKSVKNTSTGVKVTWVPLTTATKYKVCRKESGDKKWTTIATLGTGACTYTDTTAKSGKTYKYTVKCYDGSYKSLYNKDGVSIMFLSQPKLSSVGGSGSHGYAILKWKAVSGAKSYEIYRKGGSLSNSEWKKIATVKGKNTVSYTDKTANKTDWCYTYSVRAVNGSYKSTYNTDGIEFDYVKAPSLKSASSYTDGVKIQWSCSDKDVVKYWVYRKTSSGWKKIGSTKNKYYTDKTAKSGKSYTYTVRAITKNNGGAYNSKGVRADYLATPKLGSVTFDSRNRAKVTWTKVAGADSYKIYRKINSADSWTHIATVKGGSKEYYLDTVSKKSGNTYKYTVRAMDGKINSYYDKTGIQNMYLSYPTPKLANIATETGAANVKVTWGSVKGATGYNIYRQAPGESSLKCIAKNVKTTAYYDTTVKSNTSYTYAVRAVNGSAYSKYVTAKIIAMDRPAMTDVVLTDDGAMLSWNSVEGADTYYVYRKAVGGSWQVIGSYSLNTFVDTSEEAKTTPFYYTVAAEKDGYRSAYDSNGIKNFVEVTSLKAEFVPATKTENAYIVVDWTFDSSVEAVELFKSNGDDTVSLGVFDAQSGITQYKDEGITVGTEYTYTARAIKSGKVSTEKTASAKYPHDPLAEVEFTVIPTYSEDGSYITVNFTPVEFAENYEIYRKTAVEEKWSKIATITDKDVTAETVSYTDDDIDTETAYCYTVKATASDRDSLYNEKGIEATVFVPVEPVAGIIAKKDVITEEEDGVPVNKDVAVITWDEVNNGVYYKVLRKTADTEWETLGLVFCGQDLKFVDKTIVQGVEYTYTVEVSAPYRGEAINEVGADFCWALPEEPETPGTPETPEEPQVS